MPKMQKRSRESFAMDELFYTIFQWEYAYLSIDVAK